ncbi:MAG: DNA replication protein dnaC [Nitrospira sp.]|nr:MAG: DNA replication protein dnaC [Nitrospira sp.]
MKKLVCMPVLKEKITELEPSDSYCDQHDRPIPTETIPMAGRQITVPGICPLCEKARQELKRQHEEAERREVLTSVRLQAGVPQRYVHSRLTDFHELTPSQQQVGNQLRHFVESGWRTSTGLLLCGNVGTAKTMLGAALVNYWLETYGRRAARYFTMSSLLRRIKTTWTSDSCETESQAMERLTEVPLLVVDEVGVQFGSVAETVLFSDLFNCRYNVPRPTILIGNLTPAECGHLLGDRVMDRLRDGGQVLVFDWKSQRGKTTC